VSLATFLFADGSSRQGDVPEPPPPALTVDDLPAVADVGTWVPGGALPPGATRRAFALEEGGPPYRYREVVGAAPSQEGV
jgi:hypothetical protein